MAEQGRILYAMPDRHWVFRFEGDIRYTMTHPLDALLDDVFAHSSPASVTIDLRDTSAIDSTGIGLLVKIARLASNLNAARPMLFCGNAEVDEVLDSVCMDKVFTIVSGAVDPANLSPLPSTQPSETDLAKTILEAHRLLCELSDDNRARFEGVVEAFARMGGKT